MVEKFQVLNLPKRTPTPRVDAGGGGGNDDGMEARLRAVEDAITRIDATLPHLATKHDVSSSANKIILWVVGAVLFAQVLPALLSYLK
jgi:hypothetical protein